MHSKQTVGGSILDSTARGKLPPHTHMEKFNLEWDITVEKVLKT